MDKNERRLIQQGEEMKAYILRMPRNDRRRAISLIKKQIMKNEKILKVAEFPGT